MKKIKMTFQILSILGILGFTIYSCEQNDEAVGYGLLNNGEANAFRSFSKVIAYNLYNGDTVRSDESVLASAVVGVYEEGVFGKVRASYVSQLRLPTLNQVFSDSIEGGLPKATVDSVVFYFTPSYSTDSDEIEVDTLFVDENGDPYDVDSSDEIDTFRIVTRYPISNKYGNAANSMNVDIHTINEFLYSINYTYYSDETVTNKDLLGSGVISDHVVGIEYKNSNGSELDSINGTDVNTISPSVRIPLDKDYFQNEIINRQGEDVLSDQSRFIRFINGIKVSTPDNNAFLLNIDPNNLSLRMYYSYTHKKDDEGEIDSGNNSYLFNLSNSYNVRIGLYERDATASPNLNPYVGGANIATGDEVLFLDGMGGFKNVVKIEDSEIDDLKTRFHNDEIAIVGAKLKFYKHPLANDLEDPTRIFAYKYNDLSLPVAVSDIDRENYEFLEDIFTFFQSPRYSFNPLYDSENDYFEINITDYVKNIVEKDSINYPLFIEMGDFRKDDSGLVTDVENTNTPYNPFRMVFKGSTYGDDEKLQLQVLYTEK